MINRIVPWDGAVLLYHHSLAMVNHHPSAQGAIARVDFCNLAFLIRETESARLPDELSGHRLYR
ncbi:MAG: hypothetical protein AAF282_08160 [Cyanobacteria bacterium P01_A01_bin.15]